MTVDEAIEKAADILPAKILVQHVRDEYVPAIYALLAGFIFEKANGAFPVTQE